MSEIIIKRLKESINNSVKIFLHNGFRYEGKITGCDNDYLEIIEPGRGYKIIEIKNISEIEVKEVEDEA